MPLGHPRYGPSFIMFRSSHSPRWSITSGFIDSICITGCGTLQRQYLLILCQKVNEFFRSLCHIPSPFPIVASLSGDAHATPRTYFPSIPQILRSPGCLYPYEPCLLWMSFNSFVTEPRCGLRAEWGRRGGLGQRGSRFRHPERVSKTPGASVLDDRNDDTMSPPSSGDASQPWTDSADEYYEDEDGIETVI